MWKSDWLISRRTSPVSILRDGVTFIVSCNITFRSLLLLHVLSLVIYIYTPPVSLFVRTPPIITSPRLLSERTLRVLCWLLILSCWGAVPFVNVYSQPFVQLSSTTLLSFSLRTMSQCYVAEPEIYFYFVEYIHTYLYIYILYRCWHSKWSVFVLESHQFYFIKPVAGWTLAYSLIVLETKVLSPP